jgi:pimeloyl-ACP methyl ester carboxylesterase
MTPSALSQEQDAAIDAAYEAGNLPGAVELELRRWVDGPHRTPDIVDGSVRERVRDMDTYNFDLAGEEGVQQPLDPPALERLNEVRVPTLVIVGDGDVPDILENAATLAAGIAGARKEVIHDAAHMLSMERKQDFNQLVLDFLSAVAGAVDVD